MHVTRTSIAGLTMALTLGAFTAGCSEQDAGLTAPNSAAPDTPVAAHSSSQCEKVTVEGEAALGLIEVAPGIFTLGAIPFSVTIAGVPGMMGSVVTGLTPSGSKGQGAQHLTLVHTFVSAAGSFTTSDRAVCAPAGKDAGTCRVNDALTVVQGTGVFGNANGTLQNHGTINLNTQTLSVSLRGRVCGDGL